MNLPLVRALKIPGTMAFRQASFGRDTLGRLCRPKDDEPQAMQTGVFNPRSYRQQRDLDSNNSFRCVLLLRQGRIYG